MVSINISFIIPVYNRPEEIDELLKSFVNLDGNFNFVRFIVHRSTDCYDARTSRTIHHYFS